MVLQERPANRPELRALPGHLRLGRRHTGGKHTTTAHPKRWHAGGLDSDNRLFSSSRRWLSHPRRPAGLRHSPRSKHRLPSRRMALITPGCGLWFKIRALPSLAVLSPSLPKDRCRSLVVLKICCPSCPPMMQPCRNTTCPPIETPAVPGQRAAGRGCQAQRDAAGHAGEGTPGTGAACCVCCVHCCSSPRRCMLPCCVHCCSKACG